MTTARNALASIGRESCVIASLFDPLWDDPKSAGLADRVVVLGFQVPGPFSAPGPLAPQDVVDAKLSEFLARFSEENAGCRPRKFWHRLGQW